MNIVVTGATSFIGASMVRRLLKEGCHVYAVIRPGSSNKKVLDDVIEEAERQTGSGQKAGKADIIESELSRLDQINQNISEPCQIFFHFGWDGAGSNNRKNGDVQQRNAVYGMKALEGARKLGCRRFLFSGSQAEYGICQTLMSEDRECHPVSEYGKAKVAFYQQATQKIDQWKEEEPELGLEFVHTRIFSIYGPGDHPYSLVETCLDTFLRGDTMKLGACTQQWNFMYIEDLIEGLLALAVCEDTVGYTGEPGENGVYNLAADRDATMPLRAYVENMHRLCGGRGSSIYGEMPPNAEGQANLIPDIEKIKKKTGWRPKVSFEEGICQILEKEKAALTGRDEGNHTCILCGQPLKDTLLLTLDGMPSSAQNIPAAEEVAADRDVTLKLHQCGHCGLVQLDNQPVDYYRDVIRSVGYSSTMADLRTSQYKHLIETYGLEGRKFLEVGCGRGEFLKVLEEFPVKAFGIEHSEKLVKEAGEGLHVTCGFPETEDTVLGQDGPYDVFLTFNFLEHQPKPGVMLDCIYNNLTEQGMGFVTVPSLEYSLQHDGYYELIRDHIAYYTLDTLRYLMEHHGFQVLEQVSKKDMLAMIVKKVPKDAAAEAAGQEAKKVDLSGLKENLADLRRQLEEIKKKLETGQETLAVWGASHQAFTLIATTCLRDKAEYIIDSAPFKQGRFAPASHLPIVAPDYASSHPTDVILIVAPEYTEEIAKVIRSRFGEKVRIMALRSEKVEELS